MATTAWSATPVVQVMPNATYGDILATQSGLPLYTLDTDHGGQSTCTGSCAKAWPPLTVPAGTTPTGGPGVPGVLATSVQSDGSYQVIYDGELLYTFVGDSTGSVTGNGIAGFFVVKVQPAVTTTTTPQTAGGGSTLTTQGAPSTASASTGTSQTTAVPAPATTASSSQSPAVSSRSPTAATDSTPTLASTGVGPSIWSLAFAGAGLLVVGALAHLISGRRRASFRQ